MALILAGDLEAGLVGLGAGVHEVGVVAAAHQAVHLLGQAGGREVHGGVRVVGDLLHLLGGDVRQLGAAIADVHAPQAGHRVQIFGAVIVAHGGTLGADDDHLGLFQRGVLDDGVQDVFQVLLDDGFANLGIRGIGERHVRLL